MNNADMPAMPMSHVSPNDVGALTYSEYLQKTSGLSKREYFAAMAMQGNMAARDIPWKDCNVKYMAQMCLEAADALLEALDND